MHIKMQYWKDVLAIDCKRKNVGFSSYHLVAIFVRVDDPEPMISWGPVRYLSKDL